jgi:nicotinamidase-related amidase
MPTNPENVLGNESAQVPVALLLIDVINDLEFEGGELLLRHALPMAERIAALKAQAQAYSIPSIYVNDNFGQWQSNFNRLVEHCLESGVRGEQIVRQLHPDADDYFVLKPKHSGFFSTALELLLSHLHINTLILTGMAGDICVLFTANDAYMRDYHLYAPADCVASNEVENNRIALELMDRVLKADIRPSTDLDLDSICRQAYEASGKIQPRSPLNV